MRISDAADDYPSDVSNGSFTIQYPGPLGYEIHIIPPTGGMPTRVTNLPDKDVYNPCWSPDGAKIGHDALTYSGGFLISHDIYITDVATGISSPLSGAEGGNDCNWSPDGSRLAFDTFGSIWIVPAGGGTPTLLVENAWHPSWSPGSSMIVFSSGSSWPIPDSGDIWTIPASAVIFLRLFN